MTTMEVDTVPQSQPVAPGEQIKNEAGGFVWKVDDMNRLRRFFCLGSEGGTYYSSEQKLCIENAQCVARLINEGRGQEVVNELVTFSVEGRAAKQNSIIFVLAMCARQDKDVNVKKLAYQKLSEVCRIPTHLFIFVEYCENLSRGTGWGRAHRKGISEWYLRFGEEPMRLASMVTKYRNRNGWEHRDILRLAHPVPKSPGVAFVLKYIIKGLEAAKQDQLKEGETADKKVLKVNTFLEAVEAARTSTDEYLVLSLIQKQRLVREHVPTTMLNSLDIWRALVQNMPMTAMIRNLSKMTTIGLLKDDSPETEIVARKLTDPDILKAAKIHPLSVLIALRTYSKGKGEKGKLKWDPIRTIINALDTAFYLSFKFVEPTNQRYLLAIDVSGSMGFQNVNGSTITPREAAAAMSMVTAKTEENWEAVGFSTKLSKLHIKPSMKLDEVIDVTSRMPMGGTDCAQPMIWAKENNKMFDVFIVYTDCETWAGATHPSTALQNYRRHSGIWNAKLIVCGMTSNGFTIADPEDPGMLDMAGFDSAAPEIMRQFVLGMI